MHSHPAQRKRCSVRNEVINTNTTENKLVVQFCFIVLAYQQVWRCEQVADISCSLVLILHLVAESACRKVDLILAKTEVNTAIQCTALVDTCVDHSVISTLPVFL